MNLAKDRRRLPAIKGSLLIWFKSQGRRFPWRDSAAPIFEKIVAEVLLQRTRAESVASIYHTFFTRFSDWDSLNNAGIEEIQEHLRVLGIWKRRSVTLKNLASEMVSRGGDFPNDRKNIDKLPGVGQYVGNAIELFAHGKSLPLLDTNMTRVLERVFKPRKLADIRYDPWLQDISRAVVAGGNPVEVNWALLDVGGLICKPVRPKCGDCPLSDYCSYGGAESK